MPKLILLPVRGTADDTATLSTALSVARLFNGHLVGLHVRPDVRRDIATMASADGGLMTGLDSMIAQLETQADERERTAAANWSSFNAAHAIPASDTPTGTGVTCEWRTAVGDEAEWLATFGRTSDLIVVGRGREGGIVAMDVLEAALMDSGKPVLIAADTATSDLSGPVAVAWKDTREAAKGVSAALPFLARASEVVVLAVQDADEADADTSHTRLARALRWHNPKVTAKSLRQGAEDPVDVMLAGATAAKAGLIVMGGYGHTRLREAVFGGFTRAILEKAPLPVLIAH